MRRLSTVDQGLETTLTNKTV